MVHSAVAKKKKQNGPATAAPFRRVGFAIYAISVKLIVKNIYFPGQRGAGAAARCGGRPPPRRRSDGPGRRRRRRAPGGPRGAAGRQPTRHRFRLYQGRFFQPNVKCAAFFEGNMKQKRLLFVCLFVCLFAGVCVCVWRCVCV